MLTEKVYNVDIMKLSIIIVNWNSTELLSNLIIDLNNCLQNDIESEVIVVDNASKDFSKDNFLNQIQKAVANAIRFQIKIIENEKNLGFAKACNEALKIAKGDFIIFSNPDIRIKDSGTIKKMINYLETNPSFGILGAQLLKENGKLQNSASNFPNLLIELFGKSLLKLFFPRKFLTKSHFFQVDKKSNLLATEEVIEVPSIIGAFFITKKEVLNKLNGFDEDYFLFLEETDFCFRARENGYKIGLLPFVQVYHLQAKSREKAYYPSFIEYYISLSLFYKKHYSETTYILFKLIRFTKCFFNLVFFLILNLFTIFLSPKFLKRLKINFYLMCWYVFTFQTLRLKD